MAAAAAALGSARPRARGRGKLGEMRGGKFPKQSIAPPRGPGGQLPGQGRPNPPGTGMMNPPGQGPASAAPRRGRGQGASAGGAAIGGAALPGPGGRQLAAKVAAGAITQQQAQQTLQQRQTLKKRYGNDFRSKLEVGGKSFADVNAALKKNPESAKLAALRKKLLENRKAVLATARKKNKGGSEEGGE